jgi:hypothetical protein
MEVQIHELPSLERGILFASEMLAFTGDNDNRIEWVHLHCFKKSHSFYLHLFENSRIKEKPCLSKHF